MLYIALPIMNEPQTADFVQILAKQTVLPAGVFVCVNNPVDAVPEVYAANTVVLEQLRKLRKGQSLDELPFALHIIDRMGVDKKHVGVGWARRWALDAINEIAQPEDIMVWMDADTVYPDNYLEEISRAFTSDSRALGLSVPYYHPVENIDSIGKSLKLQSLRRANRVKRSYLMDNEYSRGEAQRKNLKKRSSLTPILKINSVNNLEISALRYEIYMRSYLINLYRSGIPYTFTAIGSGIASTVKLWKAGKVLTYCDTVCYPSARASNRVFFGTGPAIIKGLNNDWKSYPIYPFSLFEKLRGIYDSFEKFWDTQSSSSDGNFDCKSDYNSDCVFEQSTLEKFRSNAATGQQFIKFCTEKFDALRILQYLKSHYTQDDITDMENLCELLAYCGTSYENLEQVREVLFNKEQELRNEAKAE